MSWSYVGGPGENGIPPMPTEAEAETATRGNPDRRDQLEAAFGSALALVSGGTVGGSGKRFRFVLSGHGNAEHEPVAGMGNDYIIVCVYQV